MKLSCLKENLKTSLDIAERMVSRNSTLPILNHILLTTDKGRLKIIATDLEIGYSSWIQGKITTDGSIAIPAKLMNQFINNLPNKKIDIEAKNTALNLNCESVKAMIRGLQPDDFPLIPKIKNQNPLIINSKILKNAILSIIGSAATGDSRPEISGVFFKIGNDDIKLVATDSFRLSEKTIFKNNIKKSIDISDIIIPLRTVLEVSKIIGDYNNDISVYIDNNQILFDFGEHHLVSRLVDGQYPDYQAVIPASFETKCVLLKDELEEAVRLASCFTGRLSNIVFKSDKSKGEIEVFSSETDLGEHQTKIKTDIQGSDFEINFNWKYLLDGIKNINTNQVVLEFNGDQKPVLMKPYKETDYLYIVMPIRNK